MPNPVKPALLFSQMEPPAPRLQEFHDWYETDHIPARMVLPGFRGARRYRALEGTPEFLAVYEMDSLDAVATDGYRAVKQDPSELTRDMLGCVEGFTRYTLQEVQDAGETTTGAYLSVVAFAVPEEDEAQFDRWYGQEHVGLLLQAQDWLRVRRSRVVDGDGGPWTHFALHELATLQVMDSPERARARTGPLRGELADRPWFAGSGRWLYERISSTDAAGSPTRTLEDVDAR